MWIFDHLRNASVGFSGLVCGLIWVTAVAAQGFDCLELKCGQMQSCAQASFKLEVCGHTRRDRDNDGIPCEKICGKTRSIYEARVRAVAGSYPLLAADGNIGTSAAAVGLTSDIFRCEGKSRCRQMLTCAEAKFYLHECGVKTLDGDRDGIPCNALCR